MVRLTGNALPATALDNAGGLINSEALNLVKVAQGYLLEHHIKLTAPLSFDVGQMA